MLFFDEPTTGLDPRSRRDLWAVIEGLVAAGATVLLTTQYLEEADRLADQVVVLGRGKVIASGTPAELKASLGASVFEARFPDEPTAARAARSLAGGLRPSLHGERLEVPVGAGSEAGMDILAALRAAGLSPLDFALRGPSLDDVFIELTGRPAARDTDGPAAALPAVLLPKTSSMLVGADAGVADVADAVRDGGLWGVGATGERCGMVIDRAPAAGLPRCDERLRAAAAAADEQRRTSCPVG